MRRDPEGLCKAVFDSHSLRLSVRNVICKLMFLGWVGLRPIR